MAGKTARTQRAKYNSNEYYTYGNAVRKLSIAEPAYVPERNNEEEERIHRRKQERHNRRISKMNLAYTFMVVVMAAVVFGICVQYLNLQSSVKSNATTVSDLTTKLNNLKESNDELELEINAGINYDEVYNTAVNELGMVYPERGQVITYNSGESEYVKQYKDIPSSK